MSSVVLGFPLLSHAPRCAYDELLPGHCSTPVLGWRFEFAGTGLLHLRCSCCSPRRPVCSGHGLAQKPMYITPIMFFCTGEHAGHRARAASPLGRNRRSHACRTKTTGPPLGRLERLDHDHRRGRDALQNELRNAVASLDCGAAGPSTVQYSGKAACKHSEKGTSAGCSRTPEKEPTHHANKRQSQPPPAYSAHDETIVTNRRCRWQSTPSNNVL